MRVGDLVRFRRGVVPRFYAQRHGALGLIIEAARHGVPSYKIWWTAQNKTGWWDSTRLEKIS
jgi:hypothetical protein